MTDPIRSTSLARSPDNRMIAGVVGGIAEYFGWSAGLLRVLFLLTIAVSAFVSFGGSLFVYLILWMIMPLRAG